MATWSYNPDYVYTEEKKFITDIITKEDGSEQRNSYQSPHRFFYLAYKNISGDNKDVIFDFYDDMIGQNTFFIWNNPNDSTDYNVRFIPNSIRSIEAEYDMYDVSFAFIEIVEYFIIYNEKYVIYNSKFLVYT